MKGGAALDIADGLHAQETATSVEYSTIMLGFVTMTKWSPEFVGRKASEHSMDQLITKDGRSTDFIVESSRDTEENEWTQ